MAEEKEGTGITEETTSGEGDKTVEEKASDQKASDAAKAAEEKEGADDKASKETKKEGADDEGKAKDGKSKDGKADKEAKDGAPEQYEDFTLPEGVEVDEAAMTQFTEVAKELNLAQENAQKLVDFHIEQMQKAAEQSSERWEETAKEWEKQTQADKEIGGKKLDENLAIAKDGIKAFLPDESEVKEFNEALNLAGLGNHPAVVRFFYRVGKAVKSDEIHVARTKGEKAAKTPGERLYGETMGAAE